MVHRILKVCSMREGLIIYAALQCKKYYPPLTLVKFQLIVFRPFIDEVLIGKVRSSSPEGLRGAYQ